MRYGVIILKSFVHLVGILSRLGIMHLRAVSKITIVTQVVNVF